LLFEVIINSYTCIRLILSPFFRELTEGIMYGYFVQDSRSPYSKLLNGCLRRGIHQTVNNLLVIACWVSRFASLRALFVVDTARLRLYKKSTFIARTGRRYSRRITGISRQEVHCVLRNTFSRCKTYKEAGGLRFETHV
jgi:hypothetical protein